MNFNMRLTILILLTAILACCAPKTKKKVTKAKVIRPTFTMKENALEDIDGNNYASVVINGKEWMAENLRVTHYNDSTPIHYKKEDWVTRKIDGQYCWANNDINNKNLHGAYYNLWAIRTDKLCPDGWHVPTSDEWSDGTIIYFYHKFDDKYHAKNLRSKTGWNQYLKGTNKYKLNVYPSGYRDGYGKLMDFGDGAGFWTNTPRDSYAAVFTTGGSLEMRYLDREMGLSVRCVKDDIE